MVTNVFIHYKMLVSLGESDHAEMANDTLKIKTEDINIEVCSKRNQISKECQVLFIKVLEYFIYLVLIR